MFQTLPLPSLSRFLLGGVGDETSASVPQVYKKHGSYYNSNNNNNNVFGNFLKYIRAGNQKRVILLEWPYKLHACVESKTAAIK